MIKRYVTLCMLWCAGTAACIASPVAKVKDFSLFINGLPEGVNVSTVSLNGITPLSWYWDSSGGVLCKLPLLHIAAEKYSVDIIIITKTDEKKIITLPIEGYQPAVAIYPFFKEYKKGQPNPLIFTIDASTRSVRVLRNGKEVPVFSISATRRGVYLPTAILSDQKELSVEVLASIDGNTHSWKRTFSVSEGNFIKERIQLPKSTSSTPSKKASDYVSMLVRYENEKVDALLYTQQPKMFRGVFTWPLTGRITSPFGIMRAYNSGGFNNVHTGIDIGGNPAGTEVKAPNDGVVILAEDFYARGNTVILEHGAGLKSLYYHLLKFFVREGQVVRRGEVIGLVGTTGYSTGPHLHWEFRLNGVAVDPYFFMLNDLDTGKVYAENTRN